jgi:GxxExxY protein
MKIYTACGESVLACLRNAPMVGELRFTTETRRHGDCLSLNDLSESIIGSAIDVHRALGPGLLESAYQKCLCVEFAARGIAYDCEVEIPILYRGVRIEPAYRADFVVGNRIVVEVKSISRVDPIHKAQLLTYLRLTSLPVGLLLNFNSSTLKEGIVRMRL